MGKGGLGKTTVGAAVALELAQRGHDVPLTTTDPAACLTETLQADVEHLTVRGQTSWEHVRDLLDTRVSDIEQQIAQLTELHDTITQLRDQALQVQPDTCTADQVCRIAAHRVARHVKA